MESNLDGEQGPYILDLPSEQKCFGFKSLLLFTIPGCCVVLSELKQVVMLLSEMGLEWRIEKKFI
jgi:hypothetical protein